MSSGIDYSKWDNIDCSDDESADSDNPLQNRPQVTRLDKPCTVTRTADGQLVVGGGGGDGAGELGDEEHVGVSSSKDSSGSNTTAILATRTQPADVPFAVPKDWTEKGSAAIVHGRQVYWSQDRYSVTLRVSVPEGKWVCHVSDLLSYSERHVAVGSTCPATLEIQRDDKDKNNILWQSKLAYPAHATEDDGDEGLDWSIETTHGNGDRYMTIALHKATPMEGMAIWWKRPLVDMEEISMDWRVETSGGFQQAWKEAHEKFMEKKQDGARRLYDTQI
jgi:hypothetical protein